MFNPNSSFNESYYSAESFNVWPRLPHEICPICVKELPSKSSLEEEVVGIHQIDGINVAFVHKNECFGLYQYAVEEKEEIKKGKIIGTCACCMFPVRQLDDFVVSRYDYSREGDSYDTWSRTTIPFSDSVYFVHEDCKEEYEEFFNCRIYID